MSSRTGENILYSDFIKEITDYAKEQIAKRERKISKKELEERALAISIAAIKYSMLKQDSRKVIVFDKKESLNFEGDTGSYLLYSYARACSIIRKAKRKTKKDFSHSEISVQEFELLKKLSQFPDVVLDSYKTLNSSMIANYSYELAQKFNEFYHSCKVIGDKNENFRLSLVEALKYVLKNSLNLLGIETVERM